MPLELILVGVVHHVDLKGPQRVQKLLHYFKPDAVAVEIDQTRADDLLMKLARNPACA